MELNEIRELASQPRHVDYPYADIEPMPELMRLYASAARSVSEPRQREMDPAAGTIPEGARNSTLTSLAGYVRRKGAEYPEVQAFLSATNANRCVPLLPEDEVEGIARSVCRYPPEDSILVSAAFATPGDGVVAERKLRFLTAKEIAEQISEETEWVCHPYVARGAITEVDGKPKAAGKTTFVTYMCKEVLDGEPFLTVPTTKTGVIYLTEQAPSTFREVLDRAGLLDRDDFVVLPWGETTGIPWPEVVQAAVEEASSRGAGLLVVDTLPQFAGLKGDAENNAGAALAALQPLQEAAATRNVAVIVVRHERKSGGDVGDSGRGSSAFAGAVDVIMSIRRNQGNGNPNVREIKALSRFDETPDTQVVELTAEGYQTRGLDTDLAAASARSRILEVLPTTEEAAMPMAQIVSEVEGVGRTTVQNVLEEMADGPELERTGRGVRGDPHRYWRTVDPPVFEEEESGPGESYSARTPTPRVPRVAERKVSEDGADHGPQFSEELEAESESEDAVGLPGQDQEGHLAGESIDRRSEEPERGASSPEAGAEDSADPSADDTQFDETRIQQIVEVLDREATGRPEYLTSFSANKLIEEDLFYDLDFEPTPVEVEEALCRILGVL